MPVNPEYIQGDRSAKVKFFGLLALLIALYFSFGFFYELPSSPETKQELDEYLSQLFFGWSIYAAISWFGAAWLIRFGLKIKKAGCYPPLDSVLPFKTKVRRGQYVKFAWLSTLFGAALLVLNPLLKLYVLYQVSEIVETLN